MRTVIVSVLTILLSGLLASLASAVPHSVLDLTPPTESLGGLRPGVSTLADAQQVYGNHGLAFIGGMEAFAGGSRGTKAYRWTPGPTYYAPGLIAETPIGSTLITTVALDRYAGHRTSRGLTTFISDSEVNDLYGQPDFAFERQVDYHTILELYYFDEGLLIVLNEVPNRPNWTVTQIILTYPAYLRVKVGLRTREAQSAQNVRDITRLYRVWAQLAVSPD